MESWWWGEASAAAPPPPPPTPTTNNTSATPPTAHPATTTTVRRPRPAPPKPRVGARGKGLGRGRGGGRGEGRGGAWLVEAKGGCWGSGPPLLHLHQETLARMRQCLKRANGLVRSCGYLLVPRRWHSARGTSGREEETGSQVKYVYIKKGGPNMTKTNDIN